MQTARTNSDLVQLFDQYATGLPSCPLFREWCGISLVAGAMERRVWADTGRLIAYPNMFIMLVGPAGTGKGIINCVRDLWYRTSPPESPTVRSFEIGLKSYTKASLVDHLNDASRIYVPDNGETPLSYHSLLLASEEFSVMFPRYEQELLSFMSDIWNCDTTYDERRRTSVVRSVSITNPVLNTIMGYQPAVMGATLPQEAWDQGFMRRTVMVWNGVPEIQSLFACDPLDIELEKTITRRLHQISKMYGRMKWETQAAYRLDEWHLAGGPPKPTHSRLQSYCNTRSHLITKLAMIASVSESTGMVIRLHHVERAISWLLKAEALMPEIFRAMKGDSDAALILELHAALIELYKQWERKPIPDDIIWKFLKDRCTVNKINYIITTMERSKMIVRDKERNSFWHPIADKSFTQ